MRRSNSCLGEVRLVELGWSHRPIIRLRDGKKRWKFGALVRHGWRAQQVGQAHYDVCVEAHGPNMGVRLGAQKPDMTHE